MKSNLPIHGQKTGGMTSTEAAALYLSEGRTTDPALASMLDYAKKQPDLLIPKGHMLMKDYEPAKLVIDDPDEKERIRLRELIGFDIDVTINEETCKAMFKARDTKLSTRCNLTGDADTDSAQMTRAMLRLKAKYERYYRNPSNLIEYGDA
jgi:hypothetical protein